MRPSPAELSARSLAARLVLGVQFDPVDLARYPAGVAPLVVLHHLMRARARPTPPPRGERRVRTARLP